MPVREVWLLLRGRSSAARWRFIAGQLAIVGAIVAALYAEGLAIEFAAQALSTAGVAGGSEPGEGVPAISQLAPTVFVLTPWLMLCGVILSIQILSRVVPAIEAARPRRKLVRAVPGGA
jgi:hypothetical protein